MFDLRFIEVITMLFFGWFAGLFVVSALMIWGFALWSVVGEGRSVHDLSWKKAPHPWIAFKRLFLAMPLIAIFHPFPWTIGVIVWFLFLLISGELHPRWAWFAVSFFGWFVWAIWYWHKLDKERSSSRFETDAP